MGFFTRLFGGQPQSAAVAKNRAPESAEDETKTEEQASQVADTGPRVKPIGSEQMDSGPSEKNAASFIDRLPKKAFARDLPELRGKLLTAILSGRVERIILDCSSTDFMDEDVLGILCQANTEAQPKGIPVILVGIEGQLREVFQIMGLDQAFSLVDTMPSACDADSLAPATASERCVTILEGLRYFDSDSLAPATGRFADSHAFAAYRKNDSLGPGRQVLGVLNTGGMGVLYLVANASDQSLRVVKTLRDEFLKSPSARHRFLQEARMWCRLDTSLFIVRAFSAFEFEKRPYIEMEYIPPDQVDGSLTLRDRLRTTRGPLPLRRTLRWGIQVCMGMQHASAHAIACHRDIKPENLMICRHVLQEGGQTLISPHLRILKITDFGLAKAADREGATVHDPAFANHPGAMSLSLTGRFCGTPPYMPPEQFERANEADIRSDIYSFGLVLYEMACGHRPFQPVSTAKDPIMAWHRLHHSEPVPRIDSLLWPTLEKCLEKQPEHRFAHFGQLKAELDVLDGKGRDDWSFPYPY